MNSDQDNLGEIVASAMQLGSAQERSDFIERACGGNHGLRLQLEALLAAKLAPEIQPPGIQVPELQPPELQPPPVPLAKPPEASMPPPIVVQQKRTAKDSKPRRPVKPTGAKSPVVLLSTIGGVAACLVILAFLWMARSRPQAEPPAARPAVAQGTRPSLTTQSSNLDPRSRQADELKPHVSVSGTITQTTSNGTTVRHIQGGGVTLNGTGVTGTTTSQGGTTITTQNVGGDPEPAANSPDRRKSFAERALSKLGGAVGKARVEVATRGAEWLLDKASAPRTDHVGLRYFPDDYDNLIHLKIPEVLASPVIQAGWNGPQTEFLRDQLMWLEAATSVKLNDVEYMTWAGLKGRPFLYVIRTNSTPDPAVLLRKAGQVRQVEFEGRTYARLVGRGAAVTLVDSKTILFGTELDLRYALGRVDMTTVKSRFNWIEPEKYAIVAGQVYPSVTPGCQTYELDGEQLTVRYKYFHGNSLTAAAQGRLFVEGYKNMRPGQTVGMVSVNYSHFKEIDDVTMRGGWTGLVAEDIAELKGLDTRARCEETVHLLCQHVFKNVVPVYYQGPSISLDEFAQRYELSQTPRRDELDPETVFSDPDCWENPQRIPSLVYIIKYTAITKQRTLALRTLCKIRAPETMLALADVAKTLPLEGRPDIDAMKHFLRYGDQAVALATCRILELAAADREARGLLQSVADDPPNNTVRVAAQRALASVQAAAPQPLVEAIDERKATKITNEQLDTGKRRVEANVGRGRERAEAQKEVEKWVTRQKDGWKRALRIQFRAGGSYVLDSAGPDGRFGTADDLVRSGQID